MDKINVGIKFLFWPYFIPHRATPGSAGWDICSNECSDIAIEPGQIVAIRTGFCLELDEQVEVQIRSRSGLAMKGIVVINSPGTIDSDYRGEIKVILYNASNKTHIVQQGNKIAQMVFMRLPYVTFNSREVFKPTERSDKGFGSSDLEP